MLAYFAGWTIYSKDVQKLAEVDYTKLTHLTYAFAKIDASTVDGFKSGCMGRFGTEPRVSQLGNTSKAILESFGGSSNSIDT